MPTYQYRCTECGHDLEAVQKFSDAALTECPSCHGQLRKVYNAVGVVFKGSGFYRTDSRAKEGASVGASGDKPSSADASKDSGTNGAGKNGAGKNGAGKEGAGAKEGSFTNGSGGKPAGAPKVASSTGSAPAS